MEIQTVNFDRVGMYRSTFKKNNFSVPLHIHQCSEVIYVISGELESVIANERRTLRAGDIAVVPPFAEHAFHSKGKVFLWLCVFASDILAAFMPNEEIYRARNTAYFTVSDKLASFLDGKLPDTYEEMMPFNYYERRKLLVIISAIYDEYFDASETQNVKRKDSLLSEILLYFVEHYSEPLTINDVSRALGYTPRHLSRQISALKNYNFRGLLNTFRIERAKMMIRNTDAKLVNISVDCGFTSERSFFRSFIKIEGITPTKYKEMVKSFGRTYKNNISGTAS